jgi:hypothetical protein
LPPSAYGIFSESGTIPLLEARTCAAAAQPLGRQALAPPRWKLMFTPVDNRWKAAIMASGKGKKQGAMSKQHGAQRQNKRKKRKWPKGKCFF